MKSEHRDFFQLATKGRTDWYLYLLTPLLVFVGYFLGQLPMLGFQMRAMSNDPTLGLESLLEFEETMDWGIFNIDKNLGLFLMILMFVFAMGGLLFALKLHKRSLKDITTPYRKVRWDRIVFGFGLWAGLGIIFELTSYAISPDQYTFHTPSWSYLILILIAVIFLPIQTSLEEYLFRGYAMPAISLLSKEKIAPLVITSFLFSLVHSMNPEIAKFGFWAMQPYYIGAGLLLGIITIMDDGLELALGVHAATNILGVLLFTYEGSVLQTDALLSVKEVSPLLMTIGFYVTASIFIFICYKKYKWRSFNYLLAPIEFKSKDMQASVSSPDDNDGILDSDTRYEELI